MSSGSVAVEAASLAAEVVDFPAAWAVRDLAA
jgi:hypothetical protein